MAPSTPAPQLPCGEDGHARVPAAAAGIPQGHGLPVLKPPNPSSLYISLGCVTLGRDLASLGLQAPLKDAELRVGGRIQQMPGLAYRGQTQMGQGSVSKILGLPEPRNAPLGGGWIKSGHSRCDKEQRTV